MRVGTLRRIGAYLLDLIPIIAVLSLLFQFLVGDMLKPDNYDDLIVEYNQITADYNELAAQYDEEYEAGELTEDEYNNLYTDLIEGHEVDTEVHVDSILLYVSRGIVYYISAITLLYYGYNVFTNGNTLGRNFMKIELSGKVNWWTLLVRDVIWRTGYYMLTLFIIGIVIDIFMISFTSKKRTLRDIISKIDVKYQGVDYPF